MAFVSITILCEFLSKGFEKKSGPAIISEFKNGMYHGR